MPHLIKTCYRVYGKFAVVQCKILGMRLDKIHIRYPWGTEESVTRGDNLYATQKEANAALNAMESYRSHV
jgi:hypothetical protein